MLKYKVPAIISYMGHRFDIFLNVLSFHKASESLKCTEAADILPEYQKK